MVLFDPPQIRLSLTPQRGVRPPGHGLYLRPLGAQVGLDVMKAGGNAVDAAVAMAAAMPLLEPTGNGIGGGLLRPGLGGAGEKAVRPERQRRVPCSSVRRPGAGAGLRGDA